MSFLNSFNISNIGLIVIILYNILTIKFGWGLSVRVETVRMYIFKFIII